MNKIIAAFLLSCFIFITVADPARGYEWAPEEKFCEDKWAGWMAEAKVLNKVIPTNEKIKQAILLAFRSLPSHLQPPIEYYHAIAKFKLAIFLNPNDPMVPNVMYFGIWDMIKCEGAAIHIPRPLWKQLLKHIGQQA